MKQLYFLTEENFPVRGNRKLDGWTEVTQEEYQKRIDEINLTVEDFEQKDTATINRNNLIWQRALENAEKELIEEGTIEAKENKKEEK